MLPLPDLSTGYYLIASHTHRNKVFYAGQLDTHPSQPVKPAQPSLPRLGGGEHDCDDEDTLASFAPTRQPVSYFADGADDWAFLEQLDEDSPIPWRLLPSASPGAESDGDRSLSPVSEGGTPPLVADSGVGSSDSSDEDSSDSVRFARDLPSLARRKKSARGRKVYAVSNEKPEWLLERLPNGRYTIKMCGAPTGIRDGLLLAYESHASAEAVEEWELRPHVVAGPKGRERERELVFTIEWATGGAGWVRQGNDGPIAVAPMSGQIREEELWKIVPLTGV